MRHKMFTVRMVSDHAPKEPWFRSYCHCDLASTFSDQQRAALLEGRTVSIMDRCGYETHFEIDGGGGSY